MFKNAFNRKVRTTSLIEETGHIAVLLICPVAAMFALYSILTH